MSSQRYLLSHLPEINILSIFRSKFEQDWNSFQHTHNYTEIMTVLNGKGKISSGRTVLNLKKGDIVIINPTIPHTEVSDENDALEYIIISLSNIEIFGTEDLIDDNYYKIGMHKISEKTTTAVKLTEAIWEEAQNKALGFLMSVLSLMSQLLLVFTREHNLIINNREKEERRYSHISAVEYLYEFIKAHYASTLNISDVAKKFYISKQYLITKFKKEIGVTPIQFCIDQRINQAKYLIKNTDLNLTQIGIAVGFMSSAYFTKIFKRETGQTPSQFRE